jgi:hypothetical protein
VNKKTVKIVPVKARDEILLLQENPRENLLTCFLQLYKF